MKENRQADHFETIIKEQRKSFQCTRIWNLSRLVWGSLVGTMRDANLPFVNEALFFFLFLGGEANLFHSSFVILLGIGPKRASLALCASLSRIPRMITEVIVILYTGSEGKVELVNGTHRNQIPQNL